MRVPALFKIATAALVFVIPLAIQFPARADLKSWIGPSGNQDNGNWNTPSNWSPSGVPDGTINLDTKLVSTGKNFVVNYDYTGAPVTLFILEICNFPSQPNIAEFATLTMSGNLLQVQQELIGTVLSNDNGGQGALLQSGGINKPGSIDLGFEPNSIGIYNLSGGQLIVGGLRIGQTGTGAFTQTGGTSTVSGINAGNGPNGSGTFTLNSGSVTVNGGATFGYSGVLGAGVGVLSVNSGTSMYIGGTLEADISPGTAINLNGGTLSVGDLNFHGNPSVLHWTTGTLNMIGGFVTWDPSQPATSTSAAFGSALTLNNNQTLTTVLDETLGFTGPFSMTLNSGSTHIVGGLLYVNSTGTLTQNAGSMLSAVVVLQEGGTINGTLNNQGGGFSYIGGQFNGRLISNGSFAMNTNSFTAGNGIENDAVGMRIEQFQTVVANGLGFDNFGTLMLAGGTLSGSGPAVNDYGGSMQAHGNINSVFTNFGRVTVDGTLRFNGGATNRGILQGNGTVIGNVTNGVGGLIQPSNVPQQTGSGGTDPLAFIAFQGNMLGGTIQIGAGFQLNIANGWNNYGLVTLGGSGAGNSAVLGGRPVFNSGTIDGAGIVSAAVVNSSGVIRATGGQLTLAGGPIPGIGPLIDQTVNSNDVGGRIEATTGGTVFYSQGLVANAGTIALTGGTFDNNNHPLSSTGVINGRGEIRTGGLTIAGTGLISVGGGDMNVLGNLTNNGAVSIQPGKSIYFFGNVNGGGGYTGGGTAVYLAKFSPSGSPALPSFSGNVNLTSASTLNLNLAGPAANQVDKVMVDGQLILGGTLHVALAGGYTPARLNKFDILDWGTRSGTFSSLQLPALPSPLGWNTSNLYSTGVLSVVDLNRLPGDMNLDQQITMADLPLMELALVNEAAYESLPGITPAILAAVGDADESGSFDNGDLQGLLNELIHGVSFVAGSAPALGGQLPDGGPPNSVPEPASWLLLFCGGVLLYHRAGFCKLAFKS